MLALVILPPVKVDPQSCRWYSARKNEHVSG
jgi:hypothetical protein